MANNLDNMDSFSCSVLACCDTCQCYYGMTEAEMPIYDETPTCMDLASGICETMGIEWI